MRSVRVGDVAAAIDAARNPPQDPKAPATTGSAPARDDATTSLTYPPEFQPAAVWQYTRNGTVAGISGGVDPNLAVVAAVR